MREITFLPSLTCSLPAEVKTREFYSSGCLFWGDNKRCTLRLTVVGLQSQNSVPQMLEVRAGVGLEGQDTVLFLLLTLLFLLLSLFPLFIPYSVDTVLE